MLGQFFTTDEGLQHKVYEFVKSNPRIILEPSAGRGDLVKYYLSHKPDTIFMMIEIDKTLKQVCKLDNRRILKHGDFLKLKFGKKYDCIIGNPPYVSAGKCNLYIQFIDKCLDLLNINGELIFIIPSDFFKLTSAKTTIQKMMSNGSITNIYHPHNEKLFQNASIDIIIMRYEKNKNLINKVNLNGELLFINNVNNALIFDTLSYENFKSVKDYFTAYVGMVSGCDAVFKHPTGNIEVLNQRNIKERMIYLDSLNLNLTNMNSYQHLVLHKEQLMKRRIRKFNETNWFEWGAARNVIAIEENMNKPCLYIKCLTRDDIVCFKGHVGYFGGGLIMLLLNSDLNSNSNLNLTLDQFVEYFNSDQFKKNHIYSGRFKIGHNILLNSKITIDIIDIVDILTSKLSEIL